MSSSLDGEPRGWVTTARDGAVLTVTLDRADQLNAQTPETWAALRAVGDSLDDEVRVVVVAGAGRAFSAGLDRSLFRAGPEVPGGLSELATLTPELAQERMARALGQTAPHFPYPRIEDGAHTMAFIEACVASQAAGGWVEVARPG